MNKTILEAEESLQDGIEALRSLPPNQFQKLSTVIEFLTPSGYHPVVELQEDGRKKRRTASINNWNPETGEILIFFTKDEHAATGRLAHGVESHASAPKERPDVISLRVPAATSVASLNQHPSPTTISARSVDELCSALEEVEREGRAFIALKWFRDKFLPTKGFSWVMEDEERQAVLAGAVECGAIVTSKIANPRSPFPTTTIRLNRSRTSAPRERRFNPIRIQGEPLSATILRDRG